MNSFDKFFRTYDIRGIIGEIFNNNFAYKLGIAYGNLLKIKKLNKKIVIGYDGRLSSIELKNNLIKGLLSTDIEVHEVGLVATPMLYFASKYLKINNAIMVTGSHNPANYNGFKMIANNVTLTTGAIQELKTLFANLSNNDLKANNNPSSKHIKIDIEEAYYNRICSAFNFTKGMKIVIDAGNGVTAKFAPNLFNRLGFEVIELFCEIDGNFPNHHPDPSQPNNLIDIQNTIIKNNADFGIAFDGDGDRVGFITNSGKVIEADRIISLLAKDILPKYPGAKIIYDVKSSSSLATTIKQLGGIPIMWKTGHSLIKKKLYQENSPLAGELSGHIFINDRWYGFDDGMYVATRIIEILDKSGKTADQIFAKIPKLETTPEFFIKVTEDNKFNIMKQLIKAKWPTEAKLITIDGIRIEMLEGWGLIRASNTSPTLTLRFEGNNKNDIKQLKEIFKNQINNLFPNLDTTILNV